MENIIGKEIVSIEIKPPKIPTSDFFIDLIEREPLNEHRTCGIHLIGKYRSAWSGLMREPLVDTDIGALVYDGKLNK